MMVMQLVVPSYNAVGGIAALAIGLIVGGAGAGARAETLNEALSATYKYSPIIDAERARLRATDEQVSIAHAAFRPTVSASGSVNYQNTKSSQTGGGLFVGPGGAVTSGGETRSAGYAVSAHQSLFQGLRLINQLRTAEATVRVGREALRQTESLVFLRAISAYLGVLVGEQAVKLREANVRLLNQELTATRARRRTNELTNTDVAQAEARRAQAGAALTDARAVLKTARAQYLEVIGNDPSRLSMPSIPHKLIPKSLQEATSIAEKESPGLIAALYSEQIARYGVDIARGKLLPQVSLQANWSESYDSPDGGRSQTTAVGAGFSMPLYEGGANYASIRQAKQIHVSQLQTIKAVRAQVQQAVTSAWLRMVAAKDQLEFFSTQIKASQTALVGVRKEESIGQRSYLEILNAEQELLNAQLSFRQAKRNYIEAAYGLLGELGRLDAQTLQVTELVYDPHAHYEEVRRKWFGVRITHRDGREEEIQLDYDKAEKELSSTK